MTIINLAKKASARHARLHGRDAQTLPVKPADFSVNLFDRFVVCGTSFLFVPAGLPSAGKRMSGMFVPATFLFQAIWRELQSPFQANLQKSPVSSQAGILLLLRERKEKWNLWQIESPLWQIERTLVGYNFYFCVVKLCKYINSINLAYEIETITNLFCLVPMDGRKHVRHSCAR